MMPPGVETVPSPRKQFPECDARVAGRDYL